MLHNIVNDYIILEELGDVGLVYVMTIIRFESDGAHSKIMDVQPKKEYDKISMH